CKESAALFTVGTLRWLGYRGERKGIPKQRFNDFSRLKENNTLAPVQPLHQCRVLFITETHSTMRKYSLLIALLTLTVIIVNAQRREVRDVAQFRSINFAHSGKLYLKQGSPQKVELEGDSDVLKEIETKVSDGHLKIGRENGRFKWNMDDGKIIVYITVPDVSAIRVSGSGAVIGQNKIKTRDLDLQVSGSGSLELDIEASGEVEADVSGSGNISLTGDAERLESNVSGSGKVVMDVSIDGEVEFGISGSGKIEASGRADAIEVTVSGSGKVNAGDLKTNRCKVRIAGSGSVEINVANELEANISG